MYSQAEITLGLKMPGCQFTFVLLHYKVGYTHTVYIHIYTYVYIHIYTYIYIYITFRRKTTSQRSDFKFHV